MLLVPMVIIAASFPVKEFLSFRKCALFLAANFPKAFFLLFQLTAMYHCKFYPHHIHKHTEKNKALRKVGHSKIKTIPPNYTCLC